MVKDKMTRMGLDPTLLIIAKSYVLLTKNNVRVTVIHSAKLRQIENKKYLYVSVMNKQRQGCDFFILSYRNNGDNGYFIIPHAFMPKEGTMIAISSNHPKSKYKRFKNAWHLLVTR